jgi:hypothetical protein
MRHIIYINVKIVILLFGAKLTLFISERKKLYNKLKHNKNFSYISV